MFKVTNWFNGFHSRGKLSINWELRQGRLKQGWYVDLRSLWKWDIQNWTRSLNPSTDSTSSLNCAHQLSCVQVSSEKEVPVAPLPILWHVNPNRRSKRKGAGRNTGQGGAEAMFLGRNRKSCPTTGEWKVRPVLAGGIIQGLPIVGSRIEMSIHQWQVEQGYSGKSDSK